MKALSIRQPWAWLIVNGYKALENRTWHAGHRGPLLIHAGKSFDVEGYDWVRERFPTIPLPRQHEFERGGIVGRARLSDCVTRHASPWFFGPYGFVLTHAEPLPFRECRGQLGFFEVEVRQAEARERFRDVMTGDAS